MHKLLALTVAAGVTALVLLGAGLPATGSAVQAPAPDTIVAVTGDRANGFSIEFYDGSSLHPPTASEARAECDEYERRIQRVRCWTEVRTWYRDLGDLRQALEWAHAT